MTSSAISAPTASSAVRPNIRSAARLNSTTRPSWSIVMIASSEEANTAVLRASLWRTASAAATPSTNSPISEPEGVGQHEQLGIGLAHLAREQLDHGDAATALADRERHRAAQTHRASRVRPA